MRIYKDVTELIGRTPILELTKYEDKYKLPAKILAKLEYFNPTGSIKDRAALGMIEEAEKSGRLRKGATIIEPTSGNTGIGLASVAAAKGYDLIITMPDTMSVERRDILRAYGAKLELTDGKLGMRGAIERANEIAREIPNSFIPSQFENPANPQKHKETTAVEIWEDTDGKVDIVVSGVGTGGTITGIGEYLKEKNNSIKMVAVEPLNSSVLSGGRPGPHKIQGIGAGFVPKVLNTEIYNEIIRVSDEDSIQTAKEMAKLEGVLVGISSGAALFAALELAKKDENKGKNIVVILPDTGDRYLSSIYKSE